MENKKSLFAGSIIASAIVSLTNVNANANSLINYSLLGSGAEVRTELLGKNMPSLGTAELKCGDSTSTKHGKGKDGKCGEGKCGEKKKEGKGKDGKCGEGKCGEGKKKK